jgi:RNA polymerase sigma-70 factor (ECF subfamily)
MSSFRSSDESSHVTSLTLVGRVKENDGDAWGRLVELYGPLVFSWGRRAGLSDDDAADVLQEVFAAVARSIGEFDPDVRGRFRGWLWTITRNKVRDFYRQCADEPAQCGGDTALEQLAQLPEKWSDDSSDATRLEVRLLYHRAMELIQTDFEPQTWKAFWMSVVEEQATGDIAAQLGLSANGVRQAKSRVLRRLRAELGDPGGG